jgi:K+-sensing histidine kinase KdpD
VRVDLRGHADDVVVSVHHEGVIRPDTLASILDPFGPRLERQRAPKLHLYIVQQIVAAHGGTSGIVSKEPDGTVFHAKLPRAELGRR